MLRLRIDISRVLVKCVQQILSLYLRKIIKILLIEFNCYYFSYPFCLLFLPFDVKSSDVSSESVDDFISISISSSSVKSNDTVGFFLDITS